MLGFGRLGRSQGQISGEILGKQKNFGGQGGADFGEKPGMNLGDTILADIFGGWGVTIAMDGFWGVPGKDVGARRQKFATHKE